MNPLEYYEKQNLELQLLTDANLNQLLEIARICTLYIDINGEKHSLYSVVNAMKKTGLSFGDIYSSLFKPELNRLNGKMANFSLKEMLNRLSVEWEKL